MDPNWKIETFNYDRNDMFVSVVEEFLNILAGESIQTCTIEDGIRVLNLIETARQSSTVEKIIKIEIEK